MIKPIHLIFELSAAVLALVGVVLYAHETGSDLFFYGAIGLSVFIVIAALVGRKKICSIIGWSNRLTTPGEKILFSLLFLSLLIGGIVYCQELNPGYYCFLGASGLHTLQYFIK